MPEEHQRPLATHCNPLHLQQHIIQDETGRTSRTREENIGDDEVEKHAVGHMDKTLEQHVMKESVARMWRHAKHSRVSTGSTLLEMHVEWRQGARNRSTENVFDKCTL